MRDVLFERVFAVVLFLLLCLYYRWLEHADDKQQRERQERKRREEHEGSTPLPDYLQWREGNPGADVVLIPPGDCIRTSRALEGRPAGFEATDERRFEIESDREINPGTNLSRLEH